MESNQPAQIQTLQVSSKERHHNTAGNLALTFVGGCIGGVANILVGHPFDTLKVRMQMLHLKLIPCIKSMIIHEGPRSLYKGITSPLYNTPIIYSLCFGSYEMGLWALKIGFNKEPTTNQALLAGGWAGFVISFVLTPIELIKSRLQMEGVGRRVEGTKAWTLTKQIVKTNGIRELFKANSLTLMREVPANAVYFGNYIYLKNAMKPYLGEGAFNTVAVGGISGVLSWLVSYPQDTIKTLIQCDTSNTYKRHKYFNDIGIIDCCKKLWAKKGFMGFWKGFSACAIRGFIGEAITFLTYDKFRKYFVH